MKTLILANSAIAAVADSVTTTSTGYTTPDGVFPFTAGVTGIASVATLPADFAQNLYEWSGTALVRLPDPPAPPPPVPASITPLQARAALRHFGVKAQVDALLAAAPEEVREKWEYALTVERQDATLLAMAEQLGLSSEQLDDMFRYGATVTN